MGCNRQDSSAAASAADRRSLESRRSQEDQDAIMRRSNEAWGRLRNGVMSQVSVSRAFSTLRDMIQDCFIDPAALATISVLGEGAFAKVDKAWYSPAGGGDRYVVAVKRLKKELFRNEDDLKLFAEEVALMRKLRHRNIVEFIGAGEMSEASDCAFVVQEYMAGGNLKQLVSRQMLQVHGKPIYSRTDGLEISLQMARGLRYLHSAHPMVIHRDLKPENILLKADKPAAGGCWEVVLADFGLSRRIDVKTAAMHQKKKGRTITITPAQSKELERAWTETLSSFASSTKAKKVDQAAVTRDKSYNLTGRTGSLMYMSPEVFSEMPYSEKADVFSFGVILYEILHQYAMVVAVSVRGTYEELEDYAGRVADGYRPPIMTQMPESVALLIQDCWAQEPAARPSMKEVVERLEKIKADGALAELDSKQSGGCACVIS